MYSAYHRHPEPKPAQIWKQLSLFRSLHQSPLQISRMCQNNEIIQLRHDLNYLAQVLDAHAVRNLSDNRTQVSPKLNLFAGTINPRVQFEDELRVGIIIFRNRMHWDICTCVGLARKKTS